MLEAQKELLQMIIWSIILFQVEKIFLSWQLFSARVSGVFALKKSHLAFLLHTHGMFPI